MGIKKQVSVERVGRHMLNVCFLIGIVLLNYGSQVKDWIIELGFDNYNLKCEDIGWRSGKPARHFKQHHFIIKEGKLSCNEKKTVKNGVENFLFPREIQISHKG